MKTSDIKAMGLAYLAVVNPQSPLVESIKIDPVDSKELKGAHKDRKDKDIDNDGDADSSDEYLHNRRKAIGKSKDKEVETTEANLSPDDMRKALDDPKAQAKPKGAVTVKKAPWEQKEAREWTVFNRIVEKRDAHTKGATAPEEIDSKDSVGAKKFKADHVTDIPAPVNEPDVDAKNFAAIKASGKVAPKRPGDKTDGDKAIMK